MLIIIMLGGITMPGQFVNREPQLRRLEARYLSDQAELLVLYGRRRVGKSALLRRFIEGKESVFFVATQVKERDNLEAYAQALGETYSDPLLGSVHFRDWGSALDATLKLGGGRRVVVILDEFQYLCRDNQALPSILQRWWDVTGKSSRVFLILCGSHIGFMENEVLAEHSPLFGRRTGAERLLPLAPWHAGGFVQRSSARERFAAWSVAGGVPAYLERFRAGDSLESFCRREALAADGYLFDEVNFLLRTELGQAHTYMSLLKAAAAGNTRISEIAQKAGVAVTSAVKPLAVLCELGFMEREIPLDEPNPDRGKRGRYRIIDPFVLFWCRYVLPWQSLVVAEKGKLVWDLKIAPDLPNHYGLLFERACREFVLHRLSELLPGIEAIRVGRIWSSKAELDVVAELSDGRVLVGECKAWKRPAGANVLRSVKQQAAAFRLSGPPLFALFSLSGFVPSVGKIDGSEVLLVSGKKLFPPL